jgi:hypothetical protein
MGGNLLYFGVLGLLAAGLVGFLVYRRMSNKDED